jgi:hypothetical protein
MPGHRQVDPRVKPKDSRLWPRQHARPQFQHLAVQPPLFVPRPDHGFQPALMGVQQVFVNVGLARDPPA